jgi:hypothetical protein
MTVRRRMLRQRDRLTDDERMDLLLGERGAFASDDVRRKAWTRHRWLLLARVQPWARPAAFWDYEAPAELRASAVEAIAAECHPHAETVATWGHARAVDIRARIELRDRRQAWLNRPLRGLP